ncbi:MAG: glutamine synthetase family protein [Gammaproteobacteria bacterium]
MFAKPDNRNAIRLRPKPIDALAAPLLDVGGPLAKLTPMPTPADPAEARSFLTAHPDLQGVDFLLADINGIFRGKRVRPDHLLDIYEDGLLLSKSVFSADITGETANEAGLGFDIGDRDATCRPLAGTLCLNAWNERKLAQAQLLMYDDGGNPYALDPQAVLAGVAEKLARLGLQPVVAVELEFYLVDRELDHEARAQTAISPATGERQKQTQVYSIVDLDDYEGFLAEVDRAASLQSLPANTAVAEYGPGQYEINLHHRDEVQAACRDAVMLKRLIKGVARKHGLEATFMAKPFQHEVGSGTHIHVSLLDEQGSNAFASGTFPNSRLKKAVAGQMAFMPEAMLLFAPNANSYRRFVKDMYVPLSRTWGVNNRSVALRIPTGKKEALRIEHRVAGADSNPYLLTAVVLAGIHYGLTHKLDPPEMIEGNAYEQSATELPVTWEQSLQAFEHASILPDYLGKKFCKVYLATKRAEYDKFCATITPLEYEWYLRSC